MSAGGGGHFSAGGIPVPPVPEGVEREYASADVRRGLTPEQAADPRWRAENNGAFWDVYFQRRRDEDLTDRGNNGTVEGHHNSKGQKRWRDRTLGFVLAHIAGGNEPRLTMPPRSSWLPRRMVSPASSGTSSFSSGVRSAPARAAPLSSTPPLLNSGRRAPVRSAAPDIWINERRGASLPRPAPRRLVRAKTEPTVEE